MKIINKITNKRILKNMFEIVKLLVLFFSGYIIGKFS